MTFWVRMLFFRFCLNSSNDTPCACAAFLQIFHGLSVHLLAQIVEALDYVRVGADAQVPRLFARAIACRSDRAAGLFPGAGSPRECWGPALLCSVASCSSLRFRSEREIMLLLTRAMISSTTVMSLGWLGAGAGAAAGGETVPAATPPETAVQPTTEHQVRASTEQLRISSSIT